MRVSRDLLPLLTLLLLPACSVTRAALGLAPDSRFEPVTLCGEPESIPRERSVVPKDVSSLGQELRLRLGAEECPSQPIRVCKIRGFLTSSPPQVELQVFREGDKQSCPEHRTDETRTYRVDELKLQGLNRCRVSGSRVWCFVGW